VAAATLHVLQRGNFGTSDSHTTMRNHEDTNSLCSTHVSYRAHTKTQMLSQCRQSIPLCRASPISVCYQFVITCLCRKRLRGGPSIALSPPLKHPHHRPCLRRDYKLNTRPSRKHAGWYFHARIIDACTPSPCQMPPDHYVEFPPSQGKSRAKLNPQPGIRHHSTGRCEDRARESRARKI
jgi:hypothetical protein